MAVFGSPYPRDEGTRIERLESYTGHSREEWDPFINMDSVFYNWFDGDHQNGTVLPTSTVKAFSRREASSHVAGLVQAKNFADQCCLRKAQCLPPPWTGTDYVQRERRPTSSRRL